MRGLLDTGEGYIFDSNRQCSYGQLLLVLSYISKGKLKDIYMEIVSKRYHTYMMDYEERVELTDEERNEMRPLEEILEMYPLPEFLDEKHTAKANLSTDVLAAVDENALFFIEQILKDELSELCERPVEDTNENIPLLFKEKNFMSDIEKVLDEEEKDDDIDLNKYCKNVTISFQTQFVNGNMFKMYWVNSLMQLVVIELQNIKEKGAHYKRCPVCKRLFERNMGRGGTSKYCRFKYVDGLCKDIGQKEIDNNRTDIESHKRQFKNTLNHFCQYHRDEGDVYSWINEFEEKHEEWVNDGVTIDQYKENVKKWYKKKKDSLKNSMCAKCASQI